MFVKSIAIASLKSLGDESDLLLLLLLLFLLLTINDPDGESLGCKVSTKEELVSSD
jgi:hypothetical protein